MNNPRYNNEFKVTIHEDLITAPLKWKTPKKIFVNSMSDIFHEELPDEVILEIFDTMNKAYWHNRDNEDIIILNKGKKSNGFDVCKGCGAAQLHNGKTLSENNVLAPYFFKGERVRCAHKSVEEGVFLGTTFKTDLFFMQIDLNIKLVTDNPAVINSASVTLAETLKLSASRVLDIEYNDLSVGYRTRTNANKKLLDIYFYDSLSSGAGYSTQIKDNLDEIFKNSIDVLNTNDNSQISNFWNQRKQHMFNLGLAKDLLIWIMYDRTPNEYSDYEIEKICAPITSILENEEKTQISVENQRLIINNKQFGIKPAFSKKSNNEFSDFEISESLPTIISKIIESI
jgi:hypothetical protein